MTNALAHFSRGTVVYTILRGVSKSGLTRYVDAFVIVRREPVWVTEPVCHRRRDGCYVIHGCGYDVGRDLVCSIGRAVHSDPAWFRQRWL